MKCLLAKIMAITEFDRTRALDQTKNMLVTQPLTNYYRKVVLKYGSLFLDSQYTESQEIGICMGGTFLYHCLIIRLNHIIFERL